MWHLRLRPRSGFRALGKLLNEVLNPGLASRVVPGVQPVSSQWSAVPLTALNTETALTCEIIPVG